jgi:uncharacterized glyoxalase superfamily protein PhnB
VSQVDDVTSLYINGHVCLTGISVSIEFKDLSTMSKIFDKLSGGGGHINVPLAKQFWGATFGAATDKFGVTWLFNHQHDHQPEHLGKITGQ